MYTRKLVVYTDNRTYRVGVFEEDPQLGDWITPLPEGIDPFDDEAWEAYIYGEAVEAFDHFELKEGVYHIS